MMYSPLASRVVPTWAEGKPGIDDGILALADAVRDQGTINTISVSMSIGSDEGSRFGCE